MFPNGACIYEKPGLLWRTAYILDREAALIIPAKARHLVESVYRSKFTVRTPTVLSDIDTEIERDERDCHDKALFGGLSITDGYSRSDEFDRWGSQERIPTRMGEETVTLRLARWNDGVLVPWSPEGGSDAWSLSDVSIRAHLVDAPADDELEVIERAKQTMPDRGRWCTVIP